MSQMRILPKVLAMAKKCSQRNFCFYSRIKRGKKVYFEINTRIPRCLRGHWNKLNIFFICGPLLQNLDKKDCFQGWLRNNDLLSGLICVFRGNPVTALFPCWLTFPLSGAIPSLLVSVVVHVP